MEILSHIATAKSQEYLIAVLFIMLFIIFWRLTTAPTTRPVPVAEAVRGLGATLGELVGGFLVPEKLFFHQGHGWLKANRGNVVRVGMDDFAQRLVGRIAFVKLPEVGATLKQGERGWTLYVDDRAIDMLSPVEGKVVAVNEEVAYLDPQQVNQDPYGEGWLMEVEAPTLAANLTNLLSGELAKKWIERVRENLTSRTGPNLGLVYQDGGLPVESIAKNLDRDRWDEIAREFFLTSEEAPISPER
ncbi:MAG: glycine cleavage system protein H [Dehalococcoidia bacterium]